MKFAQETLIREDPHYQLTMREQQNLELRPSYTLPAFRYVRFYNYVYK